MDNHPGKCFTIGYGNEPVERFIDRLHRNGIQTVIDVRSSPHSRWRPQFNRKNLETILEGSKITFIFMGDRLGGRYTDPALLFPDGTVEYGKVRETDRFREGVNRLLEIIATGMTVSLMCAELEPARCHRFMLISPALQERGVEVIHILPDGTLRANEDLERELSGKNMTLSDFRD